VTVTDSVPYYEKHDFLTPPIGVRAARAAANIAEREAELDAKRDPATEEAFAARVDADEMIRQAEARLREQVQPAPLVDRPELPSWPVDVLPDWVADHVTDTAARLQVPVDLCAQLAVGALAAVAGGHATISAGHWRETLNLYLWCAMHSGAGKSPAEKAMIGPLRSWERDRQAARADEYTLDVARWKAAQKKAADDEKGYAVGSVGEEAFKSSVLAAAAPRPQQYRLTIDDTTPERLVQLLGAHQRLALISTEAGLLDSVAGAFSTGRQPNVDVYLKAWAGETIIRDRKGGDSGPEATVVDDALLTVVLTIQPTVVERYQTTAPELRGRGFFARFMPSIPRSLVGTRSYGDMTAPGPSADRYENELHAFAGRLTGLLMAVPLHLDAEAAAEFFAWCDALEADLAPGRPLDVLHDAASKIRSSTLRLAGLLELADGRNGPTVGVEVMRRALRVGRYWVAHALAMEARTGVDEDEAHAVDAALDLLRWARRHPEKMETGFTPREVYAGLRRKLRSVEELIPAFEHLRDRGWLWFVTGDVDGIGDRGVPVRARLHATAFTLSEEDITLGRRTRTTTRTPYKREFSSSSSLYTREDPPPPEGVHVPVVVRVLGSEPPEAPEDVPVNEPVPAAEIPDPFALTDADLDAVDSEP